MFEIRTSSDYISDNEESSEGRRHMTTGSRYSESGLLKEMQDWWDTEVGGRSDDPFAEPRPPRGGTIYELVPEINSLGSVSVLIIVEKHVGFEIPPQVIKRGGYCGFDEMASDLLPKIRTLVGKKRRDAA